MFSAITSILPKFLWVQTGHRRAAQGHKSMGECRTLHLLSILCAVYGEQLQRATEWKGTPTTQGTIHFPGAALCPGLG